MTDSVSVPTADIMPWIAAGWSVVCQDFDRPNHTRLRWDGIGEPQQPDRGLTK
jgi:hypothetical protein